MQPDATPLQERKKSIFAKAVYLKEANQKLVDTRTKIAGVRAKIRCAIAGGQIEASEPLARAQCAIEVNLKTAEVSIELLRKSSDECWQDKASGVETALEDLSRAIKTWSHGFPTNHTDHTFRM